ncbi:MAG: DUF4838 domain-containing protein, partial [Acidobacteriota bacterium]
MKPWLVVCMALPLAAAPAKLVLADGGKSTYSICIARDASPSERRGADELQRFLEEMSGARLPVESEPCRGNFVRVGGRVREKLGPEDFVLKTAGRNLIIAGGRQRGTMYGVYTLLEKLGCRWFTREVSRIPKMHTVALGALDETHRPAFEYREPFFTEAFDKDWAARNKTNGNSSQLDESTGDKVRYFPFVHSFYRMIPPEKHFAAHPEYFSLIDGQRRVDRGQLCLTNPEVLRLSVEAVLGWIREHPEATIFSVSQNDWAGWCECDRCRRVEEEEGGAHSGPLLRFVNALAEEIEKKHPDKLIDTLAYQYTETPPSKTRPRPNVRIRLCPIAACEAHPYEKCDRNAYFMKNLKAWSKVTDQLYVWHYNTNFAHYLLPFPDFDELAADIPMYRRHGVVGLFMEGAYAPGGGGEMAELRSYVMARLLWDVKANVNRDIDEFLEACYGRAAKPMRAYFDLLHRQVRTPPAGLGHHLWIFFQPGAPYLGGDFLARAGELFRQAEAAAESDAVRLRVRKARLPLDYVSLTRARGFIVRGDWYEPADLNSLRSRLEAFLAEVRRFGIIQLHEGRDLKFDEDEFAARVKPYRLVTLEDAALRLDIAPDLGGRIIRMIDKRTGADALRRPDPGERGYPDLGGLAVFAYPDFQGRAWDVKWAVEASGPGEVRLAGDCANGLKLRRAIRLAGAVHTETVAENTGPTPLQVVLQSRAEFNVGHPDDA